MTRRTRMGAAIACVLAFARVPARALESLVEPRRGAAAAVADGRLIVTGGNAYGRPTDAAVGLLDASALSWKQLPPLIRARTDHGSAALAGTVYVVGGRDASGPLSSVESLSRGASKWKEVAPLAAARTGLGLFSIGNRLYAAGGRGVTDFSNVVETFNPWLGRWTQRKRMPLPVSYAAAAVRGEEGWLIGGLIRRAGKESVTDQVWIYDPATDLWRAGPRLPSPREAACAAVIDGRILVAGGRDENGRLLSDILVLENGAPSWKTTQAMPRSLAESALAAWSGRFVLIGGFDGDERGLGEVAEINKLGQGFSVSLSYETKAPPSLTPSTAFKVAVLPAPAGIDPLPPEAALSAPRFGAAAVNFDGKQYLIGGYGAGRYLNYVETLDDSGYHWTPASPLRRARSRHGAATDGRRIYVAGGEDQGGPLDSVEAYDLESRDWSALAPMRKARAGVALYWTSTGLCASGGVGRDGPLASTECLIDGKWREMEYQGDWVAAQPAPFFDSASAGVPEGHGTGVFLGGVSVEGGRQGPTGHFWAYQPEHKVFGAARVDLLPSKRAGAGVAIGDRLFVAGGYDEKGEPVATLETFGHLGQDPVVAAPMPTPRAYPSAFLRGGLLYVVGGRGAQGRPLDVVEIYDPAKNRWAAAAPQPAASVLDDSGPAVSVGARRPHDYAIVIGIEGYKSLPSASFGEADARGYRRQLEALGVPKENMVMLYGPRAGRLDIAKYVEEWLPGEVSADSRVYVVFSGHGAPDTSDSSAYLVPWDGDPAFLKTTGYRLHDLYERLDGLPIGQAIVILDACFSGAGGRSVIARGVRPLVTIKAPGDHWRRLTVFAASKNDQVAGSLDEKKHGLFSYYMLEGLGGAAAQGGHLTVDQLFRYVRGGVIVAARAQGREQEPVLISSAPKLRLY